MTVETSRWCVTPTQSKKEGLHYHSDYTNQKGHPTFHGARPQDRKDDTGSGGCVGVRVREWSVFLWVSRGITLSARLTLSLFQSGCLGL